MLLVSQEMKNRWTKYLIGVFGVLFLIGMIFFYFKSQYQSVLSTEKDMVNKVANDIELHLDGHLLALQMLAKNPVIQNLDRVAVSDQLLQAKQVLGVCNISLYDRFGSMVAGDNYQLTSGGERDSAKDGARFQRVLNGESVLFITNQILNPQAKIIMLVPVNNGDGRIIGVLAAENSIQDIESLVAIQKLPAGRYIFVADHGTRLLYHPDLYKVWMKADIIRKWSRHIFFDRASGTVLRKSVLDGVEKLYIFTSLNRLHWRVVDVMPLNALFLIIMRKSLGDLMVFALLVVCLAMLYHLLLQGRRLQEQMQNVRLERLRLVSQLAAGIAHEIRNPLTAIHGYIQLLIKKNQCPPQKEHLDILLTETERIERLVSEFQMLAKPLKIPVYEKVDVGQCVLDTVTLMESQAINQNVLLEYVQPVGPCFCYGNNEQLKQVWINLMRNALDAVVADGHVKITARGTTENIIVTVSDNGCGISESVLANLGAPFFTTKEGGTGLGLSICFSIIEQHIGKIKVQSEPGKGTVFFVYLPLSD